MNVGRLQTLYRHTTQHITYGVARYLRNKRQTKYCTIPSRTMVHSLPKPNHNLEFQIQDTDLETTC